MPFSLNIFSLSLIRDAVDCFFHSFSTDIIHGKLDQKNKQLEVDYAIGRDIRPEDISKISSTLQEWCDSCESILHTIENQIDRANAAKAARTRHTEDLDTEVSVQRCTRCRTNWFQHMLLRFSRLQIWKRQLSRT